MAERARLKAQRPGEIIEAAFEAFAERGFAATRMEDIAARAGVTKGAVYFYFKTKESLFEAMVTRCSQGILADSDATLAAAQGSNADRLQAFMEYIYGGCAKDRHGREIIRFMVSDGKSFPGLVEPAALLTLMRLIFDQRQAIDETAYITARIKLLLRALLTLPAPENAHH